MDAHALLHVAVLALAGLFAGTVGTVVGFGGGFLAIPLLRLFFALPPAEAAGASLVMVVANAVSGSFAYLRQKRTDVPMALQAAAGGLPGSIAGALLVRGASPVAFDAIYGTMLVLFFVDIVRRRLRPSAPRGEVPRGMRARTLVDAFGTTYAYGTQPALVVASGFVLGFVSSFFGIGGGLIAVALFIAIFRMPTHVVTATSTLAIVLTAPVGVATHALAHDIDWPLALPLALGGTVGGQVGPRIARRLSDRALVTALAAAVLLAVVALLAKHL